MQGPVLTFEHSCIILVLLFFKLVFIVGALKNFDTSFVLVLGFKTIVWLVWNINMLGIEIDIN